MGAAAAAQIPLTHRESASIVSFVAGQCKGLAEQDWSGLAGKGRTLVIYMGVATAPLHRRKADRGRACPGYARRGDRECEPVGYAGAAQLARRSARLVEREKVRSPALIVIGEVTARDSARNDAALRQLALEAQA